MTEQNNMSVVDQLAEQAPAQNALMGVEALRRVGFPHADPEHLASLTKRYPELADIQRNLSSYQRSIRELADNADLEDEARVDRYVEAKDAAITKHEELTAALKAKVEGQTASIKQSLFGVGAGAGRPFGDGESKAARRQTFTDAYYKFSKADEDKLSETMEAAEFIGDTDTMRAVAAIAENRGLKGLVHRYLATRAESDKDKYAILATTPNGMTLDALTSAFEPRPAGKGEIGPSPRAVRAKKDRERRESIKRYHHFRR